MSVSTTPGKDDVLVDHEHDFRAAGDRGDDPAFRTLRSTSRCRLFVYSLLIHVTAGIILIHAILIDTRHRILGERVD